MEQENYEHRSTNMTPEVPLQPDKPVVRPRVWIYDLLLALILIAGISFRLIGINWGENQYLHPDERFLVWVGADISPTKIVPNPNPNPAAGEQAEIKKWITWQEYFDTPNSSLNPQNRGHGFYVYGTFPMFLARFIVEWTYGHSGFDEMTQVGRSLSALADILVILLVYLAGTRLYDRRIGLLAAAFWAAMVLPIQQAHFFTMDTFANFLTFLALYIAICISTDSRPWRLSIKRSTPPAIPDAESPDSKPSSPGYIRDFLTHPLFLYSLAFGLVYGMAVASKLNTFPAAAVLPAAILIRIFKDKKPLRQSMLYQAIPYLAIAGALSILAFRILQPYAFAGPGFFGVRLNPAWVANIREQRAQSTGNLDLPFAMQWARRPFWFSAENMILWGMGLPLGILAFAGFLWAGWRMVRFWREGEWQHTALLWGWTGIYFLWQSLAKNPTMRYQLLIYPTLGIFAAWAVFTLWDAGKRAERGGRALRLVAGVIGAGVLLATYGWAYAFTMSVYNQPVTRIAATRWIFRNIPGPINLPIQTGEGVLQPADFFPILLLHSTGYPLSNQFQAAKGGTLSEIYLPHVQDQQGSPTPRNLQLTITDVPDGTAPLASSQVQVNLSETSDPLGRAVTFTLDHPLTLDPAKDYAMTIELAGAAEAAGVDSPIEMVIQGSSGSFSQEIPPQNLVIRSSIPAAAVFQPETSGVLSDIYIDQISDISGSGKPKTILVNLNGPSEQGSQGQNDASGGNENQDTAIAGTLTFDPAAQGNSRYHIQLETPIPVQAGERYQIQLSLLADEGMLNLNGGALANEGDWDDGLPLRMDGYDPFGGLYPTDLNFQYVSRRQSR